MMALVRARAAFEVTAGVIPESPDPELTRQYVFHSGHEDSEFAKLRDQAYDYAQLLIDPSRLNWVRVDWVWF
jgi:hypothetical protein